MGDIIPFPGLPRAKDPQEPLNESEQAARLRRIKEALKNINTLMDKINDAERKAQRDKYWD